MYFAYSHPRRSVIRLARFELEGSELRFHTEKVLLEVPVQRDECCHVGGSVEFGPRGHLFLSVGDNTNPFGSDGFAPIDETSGRKARDAQRSSANTQDLRGKILRIKPKADGTYAIPRGNLFVEDGSVGRPEIHVMGNRNPFRISIDARTGYLYWGEVGPDAGADDSLRGPRGHDEINQARKAGNYGWPYFVGNNKPYRGYDFPSKISGGFFDAAGPINDSPNNTGAITLPEARSAFIWYPYGPSDEFPALGDGGRNATAGPVYRYDDQAASDRKFPRYFDGKLFINDWMRDSIVAVTLSDEGDYVASERFLPAMEFSAPIDMAFGPRGALYLLEYGKRWYMENEDARLSRIEFAVGNRAPIARIGADRPAGAAPLTAELSAGESLDPGDNAVTNSWNPEGETRSGVRTTWQVDRTGRHAAELTVTDDDGLAGIATQEILFGNDIPNVELRIAGNRTFFPDDGYVEYNVSVSDLEDGTPPGGIESSAVAITSVAQGRDLTLEAYGPQAALEAAAGLAGKALIDGSACCGCHQAQDASVGVSRLAVARRYPTTGESIETLAGRIIRRSRGEWGEAAMAPHAHVSRREAAEMVRYILAADGERRSEPAMPLSGCVTTSEHAGVFVLEASYRDRGTPDMDCLTGRDLAVLRHPRMQAEEAEELFYLVVVDAPSTDNPADVDYGPPGAWLSYGNVDLSGLGSLVARVGTAAGSAGGRIEVRTGGPAGRPVVRARLGGISETVSR